MQFTLYIHQAWLIKTKRKQMITVKCYNVCAESIAEKTKFAGG